MKTYKINGLIIKANKISDAIKSVKDSAASDIVREIKSKYPQVQISFETAHSSYFDRVVLTFRNYPGEGMKNPFDTNDPRYNELVNWKKFLLYLHKKYMNKPAGSTALYRKGDALELVTFKDSTKDDLGTDVSEYQKWVDYDMKRYHKISGDTMYKIKKAGLDVVKDRYGDYEVIAHRRDEEKVEDDGEEDISYLSKEEEQAIDDYKKAIANTKDPVLLRLFSHILKEEIEHLEELQNEEVEDSVKDETNLYSSGEHKAGRDGNWYTYVRVEHPKLGVFRVSTSITGKVDLSGEPWEFLKKQPLTAQQKAWVQSHIPDFRKAIKHVDIYVPDSVKDEQVKLFVPVGGEDAPSKADYMSELKRYKNLYLETRPSTNPNWKYDGYIKGELSEISKFKRDLGIDSRIERL